MAGRRVVIDIGQAIRVGGGQGSAEGVEGEASQHRLDDGGGPSGRLVEDGGIHALRLVDA